MKYALLVVVLVGCGPQGPQGPRGDAGSSCHEQVVTNGVIITCGAETAVLTNGAPGQVGPQGIQGQPGNDGTDGISTNVAVVQFCPNQGPTTYGHFPEQGLVVDDQILAVYYDGSNAWLAVIVPGEYRTTSTGLSCNFTVQVGGTVVQHD